VNSKTNNKGAERMLKQGIRGILVLTSMMTVSAPRSFLVKIIKLLDQLDVVQRQVLLRVTISEVSERGKHEIGQILPQDQNFNGFSTSAYTLTSIGYQRFIKALLGLQNNGQATIKAQPNVVVYEGEKALFNSSSTKYSKASPGIPQNSISTGLKLNITPFVSDQSNEVTLVIDESKLGDITNQLDDDTIVDNSITTKVRVKIGEALVFGGMFTKKERTIETKVPVLGNFPLIGQFFKNKNSSEEMNEEVFTVQPEILCD
jgi:type II secretory pathway component GspD/PulD (secretin)